jgi:hypothetical protein
MHETLPDWASEIQPLDINGAALIPLEKRPHFEQRDVDCAITPVCQARTILSMLDGWSDRGKVDRQPTAHAGHLFEIRATWARQARRAGK